MAIDDFQTISCNASNRVQNLNLHHYLMINLFYSVEIIANNQNYINMTLKKENTLKRNVEMFRSKKNQAGEKEQFSVLKLRSS